MDLCRKWARVENKNTDWIIKEGIKKLSEEQQDKLRSSLGK